MNKNAVHNKGFPGAEKEIYTENSWVERMRYPYGGIRGADLSLSVIRYWEAFGYLEGSV